MPRENVAYQSVSQYSDTPILGRFLTYYAHKGIPSHSLDTAIIIQDQKYVHRPDILATDLYGDPDLFWVFGVRNGLQDPVFDIKMGTPLIIPHPSFVKEFS